MAPPRFRPKVTPALLQWALVDVIGMVVLAIGGFYLVRDQTIIPGFPSSTLEAIAIVVVGLGLIFAAAVKMLAEMMAQQPNGGQDGKPDQK
jgi:dipeptide/tripeptide permease